MMTLTNMRTGEIHSFATQMEYVQFLMELQKIYGKHTKFADGILTYYYSNDRYSPARKIRARFKLEWTEENDNDTN